MQIYSQYERVLKLNSPKTAKAKIERIGATYVNTNIFDALFSPSVTDNEKKQQEDPPAKIFEDSPLGDLQTLQKSTEEQTYNIEGRIQMRKPTTADSEESLEFQVSQESQDSQTGVRDYDITTQKLIDVLERSGDSVKSTDSLMDTESNPQLKPGQIPSKIGSKFIQAAQSITFKTITFPTNVKSSLNFGNTATLNENPGTSNTRNMTENTENISNSAGRPSNSNKSKINMPPIVIDGKTANQNTLIRDIKAMRKGEFSVKHTNYTTIIFTENKDDHAQVLAKIKNDQEPYHTYTSRDDKSHAFVLRGLAEGTKISNIEENLEEEHDIKTRAIYQMETKRRPLFLVIIGPSDNTGLSK
ncbi:unnamed protein product [Psylliodes chrysocephalus]|uniref:Uncharacterized protein n=1 Tax=Psylliodes chrysocephalus TaxID=3402493 RepID=A0A9P0CPC8_9CUCU|nr:unnamed protein product [Psylliodes chrysocephala]